MANSSGSAVEGRSQCYRRQQRYAAPLQLRFTLVSAELAVVVKKVALVFCMPAWAESVLVSVELLDGCSCVAPARRWVSPDCSRALISHSGGVHDLVARGGGAAGACGLLVVPVSCALSLRSLTLSAALLPVVDNPLGSSSSLDFLSQSGSG